MGRTVLFVVDGLGLSGKTKALVDLVCGLDPARFSGQVCTFDGARTPLRERLQGAGIPVHDVACPDGLSARALLGLAALVHRLKPTILHAYNQRPMLYGGLVAKVLGVKGVVGTLSAFACMVPDKVYGFLPQKLATTSARNRLRNKLVVRLMGALVTVSRDLGEGFCRYNSISTDKLRIISYGVDVDLFRAVPSSAIAAQRTSYGFPADALVVGSVGRLVEQKDYPTQLRAFAQAARQEPRLHMVMAGEGPLHAELESLVESLGMAERVRFLGHRKDVPLILRSLDIFVLASKFEPYGVAILEAKAAGVAIVATRVNEIPSILSQGESGYLVAPENVTSLAEGFMRVASDATLRRELGDRAGREAGEKHSLKAVFHGYQAIYDTLSGHA